MKFSGVFYIVVLVLCVSWCATAKAADETFIITPGTILGRIVCLSSTIPAWVDTRVHPQTGGHPSKSNTVRRNPTVMVSKTRPEKSDRRPNWDAPSIQTEGTRRFVLPLVPGTDANV